MIDSGNVIVRLEGRKIVASDEAASWSILDDRQHFMEVAGADPWWQARDIAALPQSPGTIVVALGPEGIVVRTDTGPWTRHGIGRATPESCSFCGALCDEVNKLISGPGVAICVGCVDAAAIDFLGALRT